MMNSPLGWPTTINGPLDFLVEDTDLDEGSSALSHSELSEFIEPIELENQCSKGSKLHAA